MKLVSQAIKNTIANGSAIKIRPRLIAEWEHNRFHKPSVTVSPTQTGDTEWTAAYGDLNSMTMPNRPAAGIAKARADANVRTVGGPRTSSLTTRYYPSGDADTYGYFSGKDHSSLVGTNGEYRFSNPVVVTVTYPEAIVMNKIVIGYELGYTKPVSTKIEVSVDGTSWQAIAANPAIDEKGQVELWFNGNSWTYIPDYVHVRSIKAVRLTVNSINAPYDHVDILQVSPRLESDLSDYLVNYNTTFEVSSASFIAPMGKASSNTAELSLSNIDGRFNNQSTTSLYRGMIEKKVRMTLDLGVDTSDFGGSGMEYVREFTMWTDAWGGQDTTNVTVSLKDSSVLLQEATMPPIFLQDATVGQVLWQTMDSMGWTNYVYTQADDDFGYVIPFYWPSDTSESINPRWGRQRMTSTLPSTQTIWDEFSSIAESTQTAIYFDEYDNMQIVARKAMYHPTVKKAVDWTLDATPHGAKMPDIVNTTTDYNLATNRVEVTYRPAAFSTDSHGLPKMETVWQYSAPNDPTVVVPTTDSTGDSTDVTLMGTPLVQDFHTTDTMIALNQGEAAFWPWESDANIEGEIVHYLGKEYGYYTDKGNISTYSTTIVTSLSQQQKLDALSPDFSWKNAYTGRLKVTARGQYGTMVVDHLISGSQYTSLLSSYNNAVFTPLTGCITQNVGYITQTNAIWADPNNSSWLGPRTNQWDQTYHLRKHSSEIIPNNWADGAVWYGAKLRFFDPITFASDPGNVAASGAVSPGGLKVDPAITVNDTSRWKIGGLFIQGDWGDAGYYVEISTTSQVEWETRRNRHEIALIAMPGDRAAFQVPGTNQGDQGNKGFQVDVLENQWYQFEVSFTRDPNNGNHQITVYKDGTVAGTWAIAPQFQPGNYVSEGRFGTFVRGPSSMDIEYLYAIGTDDQNSIQDPTKTSFLDLVNGDYASGFIARNIKYNYIDINPGYNTPSGTVFFPQQINQANCVFDEYGPYVHEVRKFEAEFNTQYVPVSNSYLYLTNPMVDVLYYQSDAFGAEFMIANADRGTTIVNGAQTTPDGSTLNHTMFVYGRCVYTAQSDNYLVKQDDDAVRRQGLIRTQFTSAYIQTAEMADEIGQWIVDLWSAGVDEVTVEMFGNPLLNLGDLVSLNYPVKGFFANTHHYFITSIKNKFEAGYSTTLVLRRCNV